jgi:hypothetical protein
MSTVLILTASKIFVVWNITRCSPLKVNSRFGGTSRLHLQGRRIRQTRNKSGVGSEQRKLLKTEAICFYETSVDFQRTTQCYIREDGNLHNHCCENLKSCTLTASFKLNTKGRFSITLSVRGGRREETARNISGFSVCQCNCNC